MKEVKSPAKPEETGGQHQEVIYNILNGIIPGDVPFHHHQLI